MDLQDLKLCKNERIDELNKVIEEYQSSNRKAANILVFVLFGCVSALYFLLFDLFGGILGYALLIATIIIIAYCVDALGISFKKAPIPEGKLAFRACIAMEALIKIKKGTYSEYGVNIIGVSEGTHPQLYEEFARLYPALASKELKKLARITVTHADMFN